MANRHRGELNIQIEDVEYTFVLDVNAIVALEEAFDVDSSELGAAIGTRLSHIRTVFRIGLSAHHPELTDREVGNLMTVIGPEHAGEIIGEAFALSFPTKQPGEAVSGNGKRARKH